MNPFGDVEAGPVTTAGNPFGDAPAEVSGNPFGDVPVEATGAGYIGTTLKQSVPLAVGGGMQAVGDILDPQAEPPQAAFTKGVGTLMTQGGVPALTGLWDYGRRYVAEKFTPPEAPVRQLGQDLRGAGAELGTQAAQEIAASRPEDAGLLLDATAGAAQSLSMNVPLYLAGRYGGRAVSPQFAMNTALGTFGATSFGQTYHDAKAKGASPEEAMAASLISGGTEIWTEKLALDALMKRGPQWFKQFLLREVGGEEIATIMQSLTEKHYYDPEKWGSADEILYDLAVTGLAAGMGAGAIRGVDKGLDLLEQKQTTDKFEQETATRELERALQGVLTDQPPGSEIPDQIEPPTPGELGKAAILREQLKNGLPLEAPPDGKAFGLAVQMQLKGLEAETLPGEELPDEGGITEQVRINRQGRYSPSALPFAERPIVLAESKNEMALGLTLEQTGMPAKGAVLAVGALDENFPAEVFQPAIDTVGQWVRKYMPEARVVLNLEQFNPETNPDSFGAYNQVVYNGEVLHVITPREMPNIGKHGKSDYHTSMAFLTSLSHEFGHALERQTFYEGIASTAGPELAQLLRMQERTGKIDAALLDQLAQAAPEEAGLLREWQSLREATLNEELTAVEFMERWVGARKLGRDIAKIREDEKSLYTWAEERLGTRIEGRTALDLVKAVSADPDTYLSLDEFMAEQFSRAAYASGALARSSLGKFFHQTLERLRGLFRDLKSYRGPNGERIVQPGETFQAWLDKQTRRAKAAPRVRGKIRLAPGIRSMQAEIAKRAAAAGEPAKTPPPEQVPVPADIKATQAPTREVLEQALKDMLFSGVLEERSPRYVAIRGLLARGQYEQALAKIEDTLGEQLRWDRDYSSKVLQRLPNKEQVKVQTLQAEIARQDVKQVEREVFERMIAQNPQASYSLEDLTDLVKANGLPLEPYITSEYSDYGASAVGFGYGVADAYTVLLRTPRNIPIEGEASHHFDEPNYLMHYRYVKEDGSHYVLELQSDLLQKKVREADPEVVAAREREIALWQGRWGERHTRGIAGLLEWSKELPEHLQRELQRRRQAEEDHDALRHVWSLHIAELRQSNTREAQDPRVEALSGFWLERLVQEILYRGKVTNAANVYLPTADTVAQVEGWEAKAFLPELKGMRLSTAVEFGDLLTGEYTAEVGSWVDPIFVFEQVSGGVLALTADQLPPELLPFKEKLLSTFEHEAKFPPKLQGIYDRYRREMPKLAKRFGGELVTERGNTWFRVPMERFPQQRTFWDRDNPIQPPAPDIQLVDFAGLAEETWRTPERVAEAVDFWQRLGFESPFFKRWFGKSKVRAANGEPLVVYRGAGDRVEFLDPYLRGRGTGADDAKKAWFFTSNPMKAGWYAQKHSQTHKTSVKPEFAREASRLRQQIADLETMMQEARGQSDSLARNTALARKEKLSKRLRELESSPETTRPATPVVQDFYLRIENPLTVYANWEPYDAAKYKAWVEQALAEGHDGLIIHESMDPLEGTTYVVFEGNQAKLSSNLGSFDATDSLHWDRDKPAQEQARGVAKLMQNFWAKQELWWFNRRAKTVDYLIQLQQAAAGQPDDVPLSVFHRLTQSAQVMKNRLQYPAEETTRAMLAESPETIDLLQKVLKAEWQGDALKGMLVGKDAAGTVVYGQEAGSGPEQRAQVFSWEVVDSLSLRQFLTAQGVDVTSPQGESVLRLYLQVRNTFLHQFKGLELALKEKARRTYENSPSALKAELWEVEQLMGKLRASPFLPQGRFGNFILVVQKDRGPVKFGERRFQTVRVEHFETKEEFQTAYMKWQAEARRDKSLKVKSRELSEAAGLPMQLPREFLDKVAETGIFTDDQVDMLSDLMLGVKYEKLEARFAKIQDKTAGANDDLIRTFSAFTWHNSNFVWKMYYRVAFNAAMGQERAQIRQLEGGSDLDPATQMQRVERKRRNLRLMERTYNALMTPQAEFQDAKFWITMVYLAYNIKTAMMNFSTQINTWAAVTTEYGELQGQKLYAQGLKEAIEWMGLEKRSTDGANPQELRRVEELRWLKEMATREGVVDQSYAYFLAGQANTAGALRAVHNSWLGRASHVVTELGMFPFRGVERANRISTLITFYRAERGKGAPMQAAYEVAKEKVNLLQNAYDEANKPELLRGRKSILFMFASYTQFMGWITSGGYERAARAQARSMGRDVPSVWHGTTMKIWLIYLILGGLAGVPYGENAMELVQFVWRKLFGNPENIQQELRQFVKEQGGDPSVVMHGLLHNAAGFDLSGSFGLGRLIPGVDLLNRNWRNPEEALGRGIGAFSGPAGGFFMHLSKSLGYTFSGEYREALKEFPGEVGALAKTIDAYLLQRDNPTFGITTRTGERLTFDQSTGEFRDLTTKELMGMALGAQPSLVAQNREARYDVLGEQIYWLTRRSDLMDKHWKMLRTQDQEGRLAVLEDVRKFNEQAPTPGLRITGKDLAQSTKTRKKALRAGEIYGTTQKSVRPLGVEMKEGY